MRYVSHYSTNVLCLIHNCLVPNIMVNCLLEIQILSFMMAESTECRSVRRCYDQLVRGIQDPSSLADTLFARELISDTVAEEVHQVPSRAEKCRKLLSAVRSKIAIQSPMHLMCLSQFSRKSPHWQFSLTD